MNFESFNSFNGFDNHNIVSDSGKRVTIINGNEYPWVKGMKGNNMTQINGKSYIDGFELKNGEWKRTLLGLFHLFF